MFPADPILATTFRHPEQLFEQLGSFWRDYLSDRELLKLHSWAKLQLHGDVYLRAVQTAAAASIHQVQPFVARQWRLIRLLESELNGDPNKIRYGSGHTFGDGTQFGQVAQNSYIWRLPADVKEIGLLVDQVVNPAHIFDPSNATFDPKTGDLAFTVNPFTILEALPVYDSAGTLLDRQVLLWARNVYQDEHVPYLRFGAVLGMEGKSSAEYCAVLRSCWDMLVKGPSLADLTRGLMASAGLPYVAGQETVQLVQTDDEGLVIITDQNVYRFHPSATALVAPGAVLQAGQAIVDTLRVLELGTGADVDLSGLLALAGGKEMGDVLGFLAFPNVNEEFAYIGASGGHPEARFTVFGEPAVVQQFWASVHSRGLTEGKTLAEYVGVTGGGSHVPVNPMKFVLDHVLTSNVLLILMKPEHFLAMETGFSSRIRSLLPAGTLVIVQIALHDQSDVLNLSFPESVSVYDAVQPLTEVVSTMGTSLTLLDYAPIVQVT